jgi:hypothetical protein
MPLSMRSETNGLYTGTEYDDIRLGEWRVVQSYCPRRHCYVVDVAAPILASSANAIADPDAAMVAEPMPGQKPWVADIYQARRVARTEALTNAIRDAGRPISSAQAIAVVGISDSAFLNFLAGSDDFVVLRQTREKWVGLPHHTEADLPLSPIESRARDVLRRTGPIAMTQLAAEMGVKYIRASDYRRVCTVQYRFERRGAQHYRVGYCYLHAHLREG